jgi:hypothetical protein
MKRILLILMVFAFIGCARTFKEKSDFRNYLRDKHPYSKLIEIDMGGIKGWDFQVNDTINNEVWIYIGAGLEKNIEKHLVLPLK